MDDRRLLGQRFKELRRAREWSQEELAEKMGISPNYLSSVERGRENPTLDLLITLAKALRVELVDLFNYPWLTMSETDLKKKLRVLIDDADLERLREILALVKAREL